MFLQFSPVKKAAKKPLQPIRNESEEIEVLSLAPFTPNPKIFFENIEMNKTASRKLLIKNPTNQDIHLMAVTNFPEELDVEFNWITKTVPKQEAETLEISWTPVCEGAWRHTFHLEDGGRIRRDIPVVFKSVSLTKKGKKNGSKAKSKPLPTYLSKKIKSPVNTKPTKRKLSPVKKVLPNITNIPGIVIDSPNARTFTVQDGKENYNNGDVFMPTATSNLKIIIPDTIERRNTFTVKTLTATVSSDPVFSDSLESPQISPSKTVIIENNVSETSKDAIEMRLQSNSFLISPICITPRHETMDFIPNYCSTDEKSLNCNDSIKHSKKVCLFSDKNSAFELVSSTQELNLSAGTYVKENNLSSETYNKCNISTETYVKTDQMCNISAETYVKSDVASPNPQCNVSSSTYVKDNSVGDLASLPFSPVEHFKMPLSQENLSSSLRASFSGQSAKNIIEANLWCEAKSKNKPLLSIPEESSYSDSFGSSLKRKSDFTFNITPHKRPYIDSTSGIKDWSKKGGNPCRISKKTSGISIKNDEKILEISKKDTNKVYVQNPFLLAAVENYDPFMTSSLYFNEKWMEEQEKGFKNWLNALLTPHRELDSNDDGHPINIEKLWRDCKKKEIAAAPTKEVVSNQYHTNLRLNSLRKSAMNLFRSKEIKTVLSKVVCVIDSNKLAIRQDRDLHLDLALQSEIMSILLSYNPLWLRIGLETIYNEVIPLNSNSDLMGLSSFLMNRFFKDPYLLKKYKTVHSPKYNADIKKFMLKKFFILAYLLDQAKNKKLISHDPCLFSRNAPIKESREALLKFARETLSAVGDITKYLKLFGYVVTHKQTYINEFNYAVNCLGVDLRDGVRLTRVLEIILLRDGLTKNLRVPAISRLQKVHNMNIVFDSLEKAGFKILYDISAKDIVDGHKEKTLSFLWQIINKFEAPLMVKCATTIQTWWRSKTILEKREKLRKIWKEKNEAAGKIQKWFKRRRLAWKIEQFVRLGKLYVEQYRKNRAATVIQSYVRMFLIRKKYLSIKRTVHKMQSYARRWLINNRYKERVLAAIRIQSYVKMFIAKRRYQKLKYCVRFVEERYLANKRMRIERENYDNLRYFVIKIQRSWRSNKIMRQTRTEFLALKFAAIAVQQQFRANKLRDLELKNYQNMKSAAIVIQKYFRGMKTRHEYNELQWATIVIQRRFRANQIAKFERSKYVSLRKAVILIQQKFRGNKAMRVQSSYYANLKMATITIQRRFRANLKMRQDLARYQAQKRAALTIQRFYRSIKIMEKTRNEYETLKRITVFVQNKYRAKLLMRETKKSYELLKIASIIIQRRFRANLLRNHERQKFLTLKQYILLIQRKFRAKKTMTFVRTEYVQIKTKTITIQRWYRATVLMREERNYYIQLKTTTITIQRLYRAKIAMRSDLENYQKLKNAAIAIQRRYRAKTAMRLEIQRYQAIKEAAVTIQRRFRAKKAMEKAKFEYHRTKQATLLIQRWYRATKTMKKLSIDFKNLKRVTLNVQRRFRANIQMTCEIKKFMILKKSVICIQRRFRARLAMIQERNQYEKQREAAKIIQVWFRSLKLMKQEKCKYEELRRITVFVQRIYRAKIAMKKQRSEFIALREVTLMIQRRYRANVAMKKEIALFRKIKNAIVTIQTRYRSVLLMRQQFMYYRALKSATILIQRQFRANTQMKVERTEFIKLRESAIIFQRRYRARLAMKNQLCNYTELRNVVITIQRRYRANILRKRESLYYNMLKERTIYIQRLYRANISMRIEREQYINLKHAVIVVQRRYRAILLMRQEIRKYKQVQQMILIIQRRYRAIAKMRIERKQYKALQTSTLLIQRRYRAKLAMKREKSRFQEIRCCTIQIQRWYKTLMIRRQYVLLRKTVVIVQRRFRATIQMRIDRNAFLKQKNAAIAIQRCYRNYLRTKREREENELKNRSAVVIQKNVRRFLVRSRYAKYLTPEAIEERRIEKIKSISVVKIQAAWRGHVSRSLDDPGCLEIRKRFKSANENYNVRKTLRYRLRSALTVVNTKDVTILQVIHALQEIESITRQCREILLQLSMNFARHFYITLTSTARSLPEMQACTLATEILINLYKYPPAKPYVWLPEYLDPLFTVMLHWCDKEDPLFPAICTLLWLFAHNEDYKKEILKIKDFEHKMHRIQEACTRKEKMVSRVKSKIYSRFTTYQGLPSPSLQPDWGLNYKHKPKMFYNSLHAFAALRAILN